MALQGPHQDAQKSTSTGRSLDLVCWANVWDVSAIGHAVKSADLHLAQRASPAFCRSSRRLSWPQFGHGMILDMNPPEVSSGPEHIYQTNVFAL
jgi:hypothetical protein